MNNSKTRKVLQFAAKNWITIWLAVAISLLVAVITVYAAYSDTNKKIKRVFAPAAQTGSLFTSNYLALGNTNIKSAYFSEEPYAYDVIIRNYNPADPGTVFDGDIQYTFTAELAHKTGTLYDAGDTSDAVLLAKMTANNQSISITCGTGDDADLITLNGTNISGSNSKLHTLSGTGTTGENTWRVVYNNIDLDSDYCVKITATPATETQLDAIAAAIIVASYPTVYQEGWSCSLVESGTLADYDAFNYTISGTGQKTLKFSYDSSKLAVNTACYTLDVNNDISNPAAYSGSNTAHIGDANWKTIIISANPDNTKVNRYDLQVYKVNPYQPSGFAEITPETPNAENSFSTSSYIEFE